jgi:FKBP12-rapamycin complex-associated protein
LGEDKHKKDDNKLSKNIDFALHILNEIKKKLNGRLFEDSTKVMSPEEQVQKLINEATSPENLVEHYEGWQIYW